MERLSKNDPRLAMPIANELVVKAFHDLGMCLSGGYGFTPLTYSEVKSYSDLVSDLTPFEANAVVMMSRAYVSEQSKATNDITADSPMIEVDASLYRKIRDAKREEVGSKMRQFAKTTNEKPR